MRLALSLLAISAAALLAGCGEKAERGGRGACAPGKLCLHVGNGAEPATLDPNRTSGTWEDSIVSDLFLGLTTDDPAGNTVPGVAESWSASPDGLTWTFKLRDSSWSDGAPVTADDFVYALRRGQDPKNAIEYAYLLYVIKGAQAVNTGKAAPETLGVRAIDKKTLEIKLEHPAAYLPELMKHALTYPVPAHVVNKLGDAWSRPGSMVSNGPFTLASWVIGDKVRAVKNPRFYDAKNVCLDEVSYYPITDKVSAERQVKRGELDYANDIASNRIAYLRQPGQMPAYVKVHTYLGNAFLAFNNQNPKFKDRRVRLALSMAVDRQFLVDKLRRGGEVAASGFVPPGMANYPGGVKTFWADWPLEKRQAEARRLLKEAGYTDKKPLKVALTHRGTDHGNLFPAIQADWKAIGVPTELIGLESQVAYAAYRQKDFEIADVGWIADFNDAMNFLELNRSTTGPQNYGDYRNPAYDDLLTRADNEPDAKVRAGLMMQAEKMLIEDAPVTTLFYLVTKNLVNPKITGYAENIVDHHRRRYFCFSDAEARRKGGAG